MHGWTLPPPLHLTVVPFHPPPPPTHTHTDPIAMVSSPKLAKVKLGVATMVGSAKVLTTLAAARALFECRAGAEVSNEVTYQVRWVAEGRGGLEWGFWGKAGSRAAAGFIVEHAPRPV